MEKEKKLAILGFGREGQAVFKFIKKDREFRDFDIFILDKNKNIKVPKGAKSILGENYLENLEKFDIVFRSPGIPYNLEQIQKAVTKSVVFKSATSLFFERAKGQVIGITGTKGKGTTSTLLYKILKNCGYDAYLAGNIGKPAIEILKNLKKKSISILELSSFQLQDLKVSPHLALVLNIFPDHQDSHKDFKEYLESKLNIARFQKPGDKLFFFEDSDLKFNKLGRGKKMPIKMEGTFFSDTEKNLKIPGEHNLRNAYAAATLALFLKCPKYAVIKTIQNFKGIEHRLEFVKNAKGIKFYNDSASTNPQTTVAAIKAFKEPKVLIAGGKDKNLDYGEWVKTMRENDVRAVILFGENKDKIRKELGTSNQEPVVKEVDNLEEAIKHAYEFSKSAISNLKSEIVVLFSPGSASFDMFKDYAERGKAFKKLVLKLK